jgi:hypothetical protein
VDVRFKQPTASSPSFVVTSAFLISLSSLFFLALPPKKQTTKKKNDKMEGKKM